ncbi:hypothetical protein [Vibrio sp. TRT 2004]|uniref:hypothetical protein n=1 Tax=Vibrio sp. TRT 2004 TaxID=3418506 RepID=UPI003CECDCDF
MKWLELLVSDFTNNKDVIADQMLHTPSNVFKRTLSRAKGRSTAYLKLVKKDVAFADKELKFVQSATMTVSTMEIKKGLLFLQSHVNSLEDRKSYLVIYAAFLASCVVIFKIVALTHLSLVFAVGLIPVAIDRVFMSHRVHQLTDLISYLQFVVDMREVEA